MHTDTDRISGEELPVDTVVLELSDGVPDPDIAAEITEPYKAFFDEPTEPYAQPFAIEDDDYEHEAPTTEIPRESFLETGRNFIAQRREQEERIATSDRPTVRIGKMRGSP